MNKYIRDAIIDMDMAAESASPESFANEIIPQSITIIDNAIAKGEFYNARSALDLVAFGISDDEERYEYVKAQSEKIIQAALAAGDTYWAIQTMDIAAHFMKDVEKRNTYLQQAGASIVTTALVQQDLRMARWCLKMMRDRMEDDDGMAIVESLQPEKLAAQGHLPAAVALYCAEYKIERPRVSHLFAAMAAYIPWYSIDGMPVIEELEGGEGDKAYPGGIPLAEHDLMHWIAGFNLVAWSSAEEKRSEGFLTSFQFAADTRFTRDHKFAFADDMSRLVSQGLLSDDYLYVGERAAAYHAGFEVGRFWHRKTGKNLRPFLTEAVENDIFLDEAVDAFYCMPDLEEKIRRQVDLRFGATRGGVPEIFNPRLKLKL